MPASDKGVWTPALRTSENPPPWTRDRVIATRHPLRGSAERRAARAQWALRILTAHAAAMSICSLSGLVFVDWAAPTGSWSAAGSAAVSGYLLLGTVYWAVAWPLANLVDSADPSIPILVYLAFAAPTVLVAGAWLRTAWAVVTDARRRRWLPVVAVALYGPHIVMVVHGLHWLQNYA